MTPSLPTLSIALAIISPISDSPFAAIVPTCATSFDLPILLDCFSRLATTAETAMSIPLLRSIGFIPAATDFEPSLTIA